MNYIYLLLAVVVLANAEFEPFNIGAGEYFASGIEKSNRMPVNFTGVPSTIAVSNSREKIVWNLTNSVYYMWPDRSYIISNIPIFNVNFSTCFVRNDYNFSVMVEKYSYAQKVEFPGVSADIYFGNVLDIGSCCDIIGATIQVDNNNRIRRMVFAQFFPAFSQLFNTNDPHDTQVIGKIVYDTMRSPKNSDFVLPPSCENPINFVDYCDYWYRPYGFCEEENNVAVPLTIS